MNVFILNALITIWFLVLFGLTTQQIRATAGYLKILQGGAPDWMNYTQIRKVKTTSYPGRWITSGNESAGDPWDLAAAADGLVGRAEIILERVGAIPQDVDTAITANQYVRTLRQSGGRFLVATWLADGAASIVQGHILVLEADGMLTKFAYTNSTIQTDTLSDKTAILAEDATDIATTDLIVLAWV